MAARTLGRQLYRQGHLNCRSLILRRRDLCASTEQGSAFSYSNQTETSRLRARRFDVEADAVVPNQNAQFTVLTSEIDIYARGARVTHRVCDRFLCHAK